MAKGAAANKDGHKKAHNAQKISVFVLFVRLCGS